MDRYRAHNVIAGRGRCSGRRRRERHGGYTFNLGQLPWSVRLKVYKEVHVENRLEGAGGFLTLAIPLYVAQTGATGK